MKEKWYVIVVHFQFASLLAANAILPIRMWRAGNGRFNDISWLILLSIYFVLCSYLAGRTTRIGFVYMGCKWAGKAKPPRLDREKRWLAIFNGSLVSLMFSGFALNGDLWSIILGCYGFLFGVCVNLWAIDEFRRDPGGKHAMIDHDHCPGAWHNDGFSSR